jgi:hypothetical protein
MGAGVRLVGAHLSPDTWRLRDFLTRNRIPHGFLDVETDEHAEGVLREFSVAPADTPLGQAAVFLAGRARHVDLVVRSGDLGARMSRYLVDQVEAHPSIDVHLAANVRELHGDSSLQGVTIDGNAGRIAARALFVFIGAPWHHWRASRLVA